MFVLQEYLQFKNILERYEKFRIQRFRSLNVFESPCQTNQPGFPSGTLDKSLNVSLGSVILYWIEDDALAPLRAALLNIVNRWNAIGGGRESDWP